MAATTAQDDDRCCLHCAALCLDTHLAPVHVPCMLRPRHTPNTTPPPATHQQRRLRRGSTWHRDTSPYGCACSTTRIRIVGPCAGAARTSTRAGLLTGVLPAAGSLRTTQPPAATCTPRPACSKAMPLQCTPNASRGGAACPRACVSRHKQRRPRATREEHPRVNRGSTNVQV
jgi:hypothetical protein